MPFHKTETYYDLLSALLVLGLFGVLLFFSWQALGFWSLLLLIPLTLAVIRRLRDGRIILPYGSRRLQGFQAPELFEILDNLSQRAQLPQKPEVYWVPSSLPNAAAFSLGTQEGILITDGLLRTLSPREIRGVLAHEVAHLKNGDTRLLPFLQGVLSLFRSLVPPLMLLGVFLFPMMLSNSAVGFLGSLSLIFLLPMVLYAAFFWVSRLREYAADSFAARITGDPRALASALDKLALVEERFFGTHGLPRGEQEVSIWRTHPPRHERVSRLRQMPQRVSGGSRAYLYFDRGLI
jgi:heat shock protein HtpX